MRFRVHHSCPFNLNKIKGLLTLIRLELPFSAGVCVVMGQLLALGQFASIPVTVFGFLSVFLISASILVMNDYFDVETDKINAPHRPIPSNLVTPNEALFFSLILLLIGIALSYFISIATFIISIILALIGFLYNRFFKKSGLPGNLMVSFSVGMTFIYGGASVDLSFHKMVLFFGLIAALIDLGEEIAADAMDVKGDELIGSKSFAIIYGRTAAIKLSVIIFFLVVILSIIPFLLNWFQTIYLIPIGIMDISIVYSALRFLNSRNEEGRKFIRWIYLGATFGIIIFIVMRLFGI
ncbi:UbiA family prenyltransferase [Ignavibacterium sp.]|uniref:UbiA family prenyltransferase n=1 Tax=Ignavibacterium sp. TaxID=2651167 RepID=UPI0021FD52EA|nr:UbiA family prenyltransferase [Ignavibacterium sp.]BDQ03541.1 MAG: digeranylgeranylglyceryl phosphate synthase [Ignavibacterium sp.]